MPRKATGELRKLASGWEARVRLTSGRKGFHLSGLGECAEEAARERCTAMAEIVGRLGASGHQDAADKLMGMAAAARPGKPWEAVLAAVDALAGGRTEKMGKAVPTFREFRVEWTSGKLHERFPDHVPTKDSKRDAGIAVRYLEPVIGDLPIDTVTLRHAEDILAALPAKLAKATRRHVGQVLNRVLVLAVYPARHLRENPIPSGWLPKAKSAKAFDFVYPDEDRALMGTTAIPIERRLLWGFLAREGLRKSEALDMRWSDVDTDRGFVSLDENKTNDPRRWALSPDVARALAAFRKMFRKDAEPSDRIFADEHGIPIPDPEGLARVLRRDLRTAKVTRASLFERSTKRSPVRVHDLRASFVTINLALGKSEAWISDRTGHTTSGMIVEYRRAARTWAELSLGAFGPLDESIPELSGNGGPKGDGTPHERPTGRARRVVRGRLGGKNQRKANGAKERLDSSAFLISRSQVRSLPGAHDMGHTWGNEPEMLPNRSDGNAPDADGSRGAAVGALFRHAAALADAGDVAAARALHATIGALLGAAETCKDGEGADVVDLEAVRAGKSR